MFSKPQSLKVAKFLLLNGLSGFSQNAVARATGVSVSRVNVVVKSLKSKYIVSDGHPAKLTEPRKFLTTLAAESSMAERLYKAYEFPGEKKSIEATIAREFGEKIEYAFALLSALPHHASHIAQGQQVSVYVNKKQLEQADELLRKAGAEESRIGNVQVFNANEGILFDRKKTSSGYVVSLEQLLIDLYSSAALLYVGQELLLSKTQ